MTLPLMSELSNETARDRVLKVTACKEHKKFKIMPTKNSIKINENKDENR